MSGNEKGVAMPSQSQIKFWAELLESKDFGPTADKVKLSKEFAKLDKRSASAWIEKAIGLPKIADEDLPEIVTPAF